MKKYNILQTNPKSKYQGSHYAITGTGGFEINNPISELRMKPILQFGKYDLTNTLQIIMNKDVFNSKIGEFDTSGQMFLIDTIRLETDDFLLVENQIISLGSLETIYMDFKKYVYDYFKMSYFINLFNENPNPNIEREELCRMIREDSFSGNIQITGINYILKHVIEYNIFGNRNNNEKKYGFLNGDIFFIPEGLSIKLSVDCGISKIYKIDISIRLE